MTQIDTRPGAAIRAESGTLPKPRQFANFTFTLEFECGGRPYIWTGTARSRFDAESIARSHLYLTEGGFHNPSARLVRVETTV